MTTGRTRQNEAARMLRARGYHVINNISQMKGGAHGQKKAPSTPDLLGFKPGEVVLVECKTKKWAPQERKVLRQFVGPAIVRAFEWRYIPYKGWQEREIE